MKIIFVPDIKGVSWLISERVEFWKIPRKQSQPFQINKQLFLSKFKPIFSTTLNLITND